ncbi:proteinase-activated receptor 1-like [Sinocyclocheilus rhinocerous]|uniref:proteinase-activated receptor 1-like n=1 Tax=Sinocyclocheilus rhinocerous TaxID=307959 RepID=UPI0007B7D827|nr:PREDICTED: proteinase-activated receptor 1-like [Sinocyclocheilus rhinocerous]
MNLGSVEGGGSSDVTISKSEPLLTEETEHSESEEALSVLRFIYSLKVNPDRSFTVVLVLIYLFIFACLFTDPIIIRILEDQPCNSTDLNAVDCNKTTQHTYNISDESVDFLKGLLVTRIMPSFYIFIILISLPLNALALVAFTCRIREKKPAVIYMSHLACVDLLFTLLLPLKIHYQLNASDWVFGEAACRVISAAYYCYMYCSILLMMCMSVDRLLAVAFPVASLTWRSTRKATCVCVLVWLLAIAGTVPLLLVRQTVKTENVGVTCHDVLRKNYTTVMYYVYLFSILSCLYFFLPLVISFVSYITIIYALSVKSDRLATSSSSSDKRRRAVIMAVAVLTEFVLCFAPTNGIMMYHCYLLANGGHREGDSSYAAYLLAVCLGSASVFLDPLLYYYGSSQCRKYIRSVFWCNKAKKRAKTLSDT